MFSIRDAYTKACYESKDLHLISEDEKHRLQEHLKKMYLDLQRICDKYNLHIIAGYGTVLGAIRHKGFIPWDDDLDVFMTRDDLEVLLSVYSSELPNNLQIYGPGTPNGARNCFYQLVDTSTRLIGASMRDNPSQGIYIDIFILENCPVNKFNWKYRQFYANLLRLITKCVFDVENDNVFVKKLLCSNSSGKRAYYIRKLIGKMFCFRTANSWVKDFDKFISYRKKTGFYSLSNGGPYDKYNKPIHEDIYFPPKKVQFEDIEIYVPNQPEKYCEIEYGDWKWIPPTEKRQLHFISKIKF